MSQMFGFVVHKHKRQGLNICDDSHDALAVTAITITSEIVEVIKDFHFSEVLGELSRELQTLKKSLDVREENKVKFQGRGNSSLDNFHSDFRGILLVAVHALFDLKKDANKRSIPVLHYGRMCVLRILIKMCSIISKEREENAHLSDHCFPYSTSLKIEDHKEVLDMDISSFFNVVGNHYEPKQKAFFKTMICTTASHSKSSTLAGTHSNHNILKTSFFMAASMYYTFAPKAAASECISFFSRVTAQSGRSMWNILDEGLMRPFNPSVFKPVPVSHLFKVPSWRPSMASPLSPEAGPQDQELVEVSQTDIADIVIEAVGEQKEGIVSVDRLEHFNSSIKKNFNYINHSNEHIGLRLISPFNLKHDLELKRDNPLLHSVCLCGMGCACCKYNGELTGDLIFHIHGGGFVAMTSHGHESYLRVWAKETRMPIISIDYSVAPEHMYPIQVEECFEAYKWIVNNAEKILGVPLRNIYVAGDSAGGNLTLTTTLRCINEGFRIPDGLVASYPAAYLFNAPSPARLVALVDPLVNFSFLKMCTDSYLDNSADPKNDCFISPAVAPNEYYEKFPPTYMTTGTLDPLFDDCMYVARRINKNNGGKLKLEVYDGLGHGFLNMVDVVPEGLAAAKRVSSWLVNLSQT
ncbi:lipase [Acrasis kona]|uniref:Lipase n=1 Tax=Acrasis kona TaxID=1008807 RepID=A0AAW2YTG0_9EUKA